jgi:hypothetical protein
MAAIVLVAFSLYLLIMGLRIHSAYAGVTSCRPALSTRCQNLVFGFSQGYHEQYGPRSPYDPGYAAGRC